MFTEEEIDIIRNWGEMEGGQFISVVSPKTGIPYITPLNFVFHNGNFYTSINKKAAKVRFIKGGSTTMSLIIYINGTRRKPYIGVVGSGNFMEDTGEEEHFLNIMKKMKATYEMKRIDRWLKNEEVLTLKFVPESVYGKTRGAN